LTWLWLAGLFTARLACGAMDGDATPSLVLAERAYDAAKARYQTNLNDDAAAQQFSSACFDLADQTPKDETRATLAHEGIQVCRVWLQRKPDSAAGHYYLGMNLCQLARTKSLGALPLVKEIEKEWLISLSLDPHFDFAGADRNLGLLYRDTPGFPLSIGSKTKAEQNLAHAVELNPEYPENYLNLIETHLKRKSEAVPAEYKKLLEILPAARKRFTGPQWQSAWEDWNPRIEKIKAKLPDSH
jgi:hypothetical protein